MSEEVKVEEKKEELLPLDKEKAHFIIRKKTQSDSDKERLAAYINEFNREIVAVCNKFGLTYKAEVKPTLEVTIQE